MISHLCFRYVATIQIHLISTQIKYSLPEDAVVSITIFDVMGRSIRSLMNERQSAGYYSIGWNAKNDLGERVLQVCISMPSRQECLKLPKR